MSKTMLLSSWLRNWKRSAPAPYWCTATSPRQRAAFRPRVEALEDRCLLSALTVTNAQNSGHGSLRAEIAAARSGDTIVFSPQLDGKTITLTTGQLDLTKNLTIQGPGAGQLTISGNSSNMYTGHYYTRVFEVAANVTVSLSGLTISKGSSFASVSSSALWDGYGGAILNLGTLTVSACTIDNSHALNRGGGIFNNGTLTVSGCTVSSNQANDGGGMWNQGTATLISSTISNNGASDTSSGSYQPDGVGGGIVNDGTMTLHGCTVSFNYSNSVAGGIYNEGTLTVSGCTVTGNSADFGGGIYNDTSGTVTIEVSSTITGNNTADVYNLGVLYLDSTSTIGTLDGNPAIPISSNQPNMVQTDEANNWMGVGPAVEVLNS